MKFRVLPHSEDRFYYVIEYKRDGLFSIWTRLTEAFIIPSMPPNHWFRKFPCMFRTQAEAIARAKELDEAKVDAWLAEQSALYDRKEKEYWDKLNKERPGDTVYI